MPTGTYDRVEIDSTSFSGRDSINAIGAMSFNSTVPGAVVEVTNSSFERMNIGAFAAERLKATSGGRDFTVSGGPTSTTRPAGRGASPRTTHSPIVGGGGCLRVFSAGLPGIIVRRNQIVAPATSVAFGGIYLSPAATGAQGPILVEDNDVTSHRIPVVANNPLGWEFQNGIHINTPPNPAQTAVYTIRNNRVIGAHSGVTATLSADVRDNVIRDGFFVFRQQNATSFTFQRNDAIGNLSSFQAPVVSTGNFQCNWWGSVAGPIAPPPAVPVARYSPWAMAPIAGTANSCP